MIRFNLLDDHMQDFQDEVILISKKILLVPQYHTLLLSSLR